jgi:DNA polymerase III subunit delta'
MSFSRAAAFDLIRRAHANQRLGHAYLISGAKGSGKRDLALQIAALANDVPASDVASHPDLHIAEPESKSRRIVIDQVRALEKELQMRSLLGGKKIGIVFEADRLQIQASNAFLKTLEEPPANSLLMLTTSIPEALPETIISRCIPIPLRSTDSAGRTVLQQELLNALRGFFQQKSAGVTETIQLVRKFTQLLQQARQAIHEESAEELGAEEKLYKGAIEGDWLEDREAHFKALDESRYLQQRAEAIEVLLEWWGDVLRQQQGHGRLDLPEFAADTARIAQQITPVEGLRRIAHLDQLREVLERNVQELLAIEAAFLKVFTWWNAPCNTSVATPSRQR